MKRNAIVSALVVGLFAAIVTAALTLGGTKPHPAAESQPV